MSVAKIQVPTEHLGAVRESLIGRGADGGRAEEIEDLLGQIASAVTGESRSCVLTGSRPVLWSAVYDSLCAAAEQLVDDCNEYWRGAIAPDAARAGVAAVDARLELLLELGDPPGT